MKRPRITTGALALVMLSALGAFSARADPTPTDSPEAPGAVELTVSVEGASPSAEDIRAAVQNELRVPVRLAAPGASAALSVTITSDHRATVSYRGSSSETVKRSIDLPVEPGAATEAVALLAGNVARDESAEILAELTKPPPSPPPAPAAKPAPEPPPPKKPTELPYGKRAFDVSLFHPLSLDPHSERYAYKLELGLFYGRVGAIRGFGGNVFVLAIDQRLEGVAWGTVGLSVGGDVDGIAGSGLVSLVHGSVHGAQVAGIVNVGSGPIRGVDVAGIANIRSESVQGIQASAIVNVAGAVTGAQASLINTATGPVRGVQGGLVNVASEPVHGIQVGLVNVAPDSDLSVGLVNVMYHGRTHLDLWVNDLGAFVGIEHGGKYFHNIYAVGAPFGAGASYLVTLGLGAHLPVSRSFFADLDVLTHGTFDDTNNRWSEALEGRLLGGIQLSPGFGVFAGPCFHVSHSLGLHFPLGREGFGGTLGMALL